MLPAQESISVNEVFSSSSSSSPISDPRSQVDINNNQLENQVAIDILKIDLLCDESFSQIMKEEEFICDASSKEIAISDAFSTNYIVAALNKRKRTRSDDDDEEEEEEDGDAIKTICNINKLSRIHEKEGKKATKDRMKIKNLN
ncbi:hypothetical protein H5410_022288 [Solanum commersonii]|uniref:Uncharacterized protein n=1 Tax=Solanum commersonii TaxID=4109 RepID=A0A9J5ZGC2_SOLCO|nr:hypothetical protein H5410_022288 [Solanum commersonii]